VGNLRGALAAAVTPLHDDGSAIDDESVGPLLRYLADGGLDGALLCGTTGEGLLLRVDERMHVVERALETRPEGFQIAVHAGAQSTDDTVTLAAHARDHDADAVAVIAPPFFPLDGDELFAHLTAAAAACDPIPFYLYEFDMRSGYPIPVEVVLRVRDAVANFGGLKVSDRPFEKLRPYLLPGIDVFVGSEPLVQEGMRRGALGAVSGLASAWPETVSDLVHAKDATAHARVVELRERLAGLPFHAALKETLLARGAIRTADVRPPLRGLSDDERSFVYRLTPVDRRSELFRLERERWREFEGLVERIPQDRMEEPTLNPDGWTVKDLLWHVGSWDAEAARILERVRLGTHEEREYDTDETNAAFLGEGRRRDLETVRAEWSEARERVLREMEAIPEVTPTVEEWFSESAYKHIDDHLPELRRFVAALELR
jgi:dihydrodipicolinate synthase/N-acetylneuraminate lyase